MSSTPQKSSISRKKRILVFCDYYLPSKKAGGGTWTVVNLIERFCVNYDFFVVTRNHESRNDLAPYTSVKTREWNRVGNADVFYLAPNDQTIKVVSRLVHEIVPDGIFLNSVFSTSTRTVLTARRIGSISRIPVIIAATGELSEAALKLKRWKKATYLFVAKVLRLFEDVCWKASSNAESREIKAVFGNSVRLAVAPDLPPREILPGLEIHEKPKKRVGAAKIVFLSRIVRKKNLGFLLELLNEVKSGEIELTIAGPVEDARYWKECNKLIRSLPPNVTVTTIEAVHYVDGLNLLKASHFFVLPTLNENFGYVILEAMAAGCPVMISDQTYWQNLEKEGAGWMISLTDIERWRNAIKECLEMDQPKFEAMASRARTTATAWLKGRELEAATAQLMEEAYG